MKRAAKVWWLLKTSYSIAFISVWFIMMRFNFYRTYPSGPTSIMWAKVNQIQFTKVSYLLSCRQEITCSLSPKYVQRMNGKTKEERGSESKLTTKKIEFSTLLEFWLKPFELFPGFKILYYDMVSELESQECNLESQKW